MNEKLDKQLKREEFPSLKTKHKIPRGWIQWKGTDVCMDIHCNCGKLLHIDTTFAYHIKCPYCKRVYECDGHIKLHELDFEPEGTILIEKGLDD